MNDDYTNMAVFISCDMLDAVRAALARLRTDPDAPAVEAYWQRRVEAGLRGAYADPAAERGAGLRRVLRLPFVDVVDIPPDLAPLFEFRAAFNAFLVAYASRDNPLEAYYETALRNANGSPPAEIDAQVLRELVYLFLLRFDDSAREVADALPPLPPPLPFSDEDLELQMVVAALPPPPGAPIRPRRIHVPTPWSIRHGRQLLDAALAAQSLVPPLIAGDRPADLADALRRAILCVPYLLRRPDMIHSAIARLYSSITSWRPDIAPTTPDGLLVYLRFFTLTHLQMLLADVRVAIRDRRQPDY
jgi:hypothetical protein